MTKPKRLSLSLSVAALTAVIAPLWVAPSANAIVWCPDGWVYKNGDCVRSNQCYLPSACK